MSVPIPCVGDIVGNFVDIVVGLGDLVGAISKYVLIMSQPAFFADS